MEYSEIVKELYKTLPIFQRVGAAAYKDNLNNTLALMKMLSNPEKEFRTIHVAGTNGKGSISSFLASILMENGLKVGLHTSPHLKDLRERIVINGKICGKIYIIDFMKQYREKIKEISPSFFELMVAMAFNYFAKKEVDIAVIEVGMGGRLDSTNVIMPEVSVITNISYDHTQFLGSTLPLIAKEKAGIIKNDIPVVISQSQEEVKQVFIDKAKETKSKIVFADNIFSAKNIRLYENKLVIDIYKGKKLYIKDLTSALTGIYQVQNILGVLATIEELNNKGYNISNGDIIKGIKNVQKNFPLNGRWQTISNNPLTICDTGHNEDGLKYVTKQLSNLKYKHLNFVFGMVNDKDIDKELILLPKNNVTYFLCKANIPRGLDINILEKKFIDSGFSCQKYSSVKEALYYAQEDAKKTNSIVFVGGSTYTVAEIV